MGFLTSSFMKSFAVRMHLQAQRRLMCITLQVGRVQRQQRSLQSQMKNQQKLQNAALQGPYQQKLQGFYASLQEAQQSGNQSAISTAQQSIFQAQQEYQMNREYQSTIFDSWYEAQLEPLKDLEDQLQIEKQQAETDAQFWKGVQDSYTSAVKEDIKSVIPESA